MRNILIDIVKHTGDTNLVDSVLVSGNEDATIISGVAKDRTAVIECKLNEPNPNFVGLFGMTNMSLLKFYLNYSAYSAEDSDIRTVVEDRNGTDVITEIIFSDADGYNTASYRVADHRLVSPNPELLIKSWDISAILEPNKIKEFEALGNGLGSFEKVFNPRVDDNGNLRFHIGDVRAATHRANIVMASGFNDVTFGDGVFFPLKNVITVLKLGVNDKVPVSIKIMNKALQITMETEHASYKYVFLAVPRK